MCKNNGHIIWVITEKILGAKPPGSYTGKELYDDFLRTPYYGGTLRLERVGPSLLRGSVSPSTFQTLLPPMHISRLFRIISSS